MGKLKEGLGRQMEDLMEKVEGRLERMEGWMEELVIGENIQKKERACELLACIKFSTSACTNAICKCCLW